MPASGGNRRRRARVRHPCDRRCRREFGRGPGNRMARLRVWFVSLSGAI